MKLPLLPHEIVFGAFLLFMGGSVFAARGPLEPLAWAFIAQAGVILALAVRAARTPENETRQRARLLFSIAATCISYLALGPAMAAVQPLRFDAALARADAALLGTAPALWLEPYARPWLTELFSACYIFFYPWMFLGWLFYARGRLRDFRALCAGTLLIYGIGFFGYALLPAAGPHRFAALAAQFHAPLEGWLITALLSEIVTRGCNGVDVFPSLHCAVSGFLLWFESRRSRTRFRLLLLPCIGLWVATVYLRYHYFVDVLAGAALCAFAVWFVRRSEDGASEGN